MSAVYAIIPAVNLVAINAACVALGWGLGVFGGNLTTDDPATLSSPVTHGHMYNASALPTDFSMLAAARAGAIPANDVNDNPIAWGENGVIAEADALVAFSALQVWANDSDREASVFAAEQRAGLGISIMPDAT